jgi:hypothetical protein
MATTRPRHRVRAVLLAIAIAASATAVVACKRGSGGGATPPVPALSDAELARRKNVALAYLEAELPEANKRFDELIRLLPGEPMVHANRGLLALRDGEVDGARAALDEAGRLAPDHPEVAILRAHAAILAGDGAAARRILQPAVAAHPRHLQARWMLIDVLRRFTEGESVDVRPHLAAIIDAAPENVVARLALARAEVESGDLAAAARGVDELERLGALASPEVRAHVEHARTVLAAGDPAIARTAVIVLDNVLKPAPAWQSSMKELRGPPVPVASPIWDFIVTKIAEPDGGPHHVPVRMRAVEVDPAAAGAATAATLVHGAAPRPLVAVARGARIDVRDPAADGGASIDLGAAATVDRLVAADWNNDRRMDLAAGLADGTVRLITRDEAGGWTAPAAGTLLSPLPGDAPDAGRFALLLPWEADHDGDLDLLASRRGAALALLRNAGDGTLAEAGPDGALIDGRTALRDACAVDFDEDGDLDLVGLLADGAPALVAHRRSGGFDRRSLVPAPAEGASQAAPAYAALAILDCDHDGWFDVALLDPAGGVAIGMNRQGSGIELRAVAEVARGAGRADFVREIDVDNDGWIDLLVVTSGRGAILVNEGDGAFRPAVEILPPDAPLVRDAIAGDHDADGDLDLLVVTEDGRASIWSNEGGSANAWQQVRLEAILEGGQRNNAFGVGGIVEVRAGRFYHKERVTSAVTHLGLGASGPADAVRIVWPSGVPQNRIEPAPNEAFVEEQTLKGSCPFLFAWNGSEQAFVTDILWRSPLGMKLNAQTVALAVTTTDYVKVAADQLRARDGRYDLEIAAALWETHFIDEVALLAVDHPADVEVFVDERFVAPQSPPFEVHVVDALRPPVAALDHRGRDVLATVRDRDGDHLGGFALGRYQGLAEDHFVEVDLGPWDGDVPVKLVATGWIHPTDTSVNVAIGQGPHGPPRPLAVAVPGAAGEWVEVIPNAGFPAGKHKTIVLDLTGAFRGGDHRVRLRTNLEIYWDRIGVALGRPAFHPRLVALTMIGAELAHRGMPAMVRADATSPEIPDGTRLVRAPRWRDLEGWYTRYGPVDELVAAIDDRYVIMNAGDVLRLSFDAGAAPPPGLPAGWIRDFILVSDGWVKDGDLNTVASRTVGPLPFHAMAGYETPPGDAREVLPDHPDWRTYHTRYVTAEPFRAAMVGKSP